MLVGEVVILQLGTNVEQVAGLLGLVEHTAQGIARVAGKRLTIGECTRRRTRGLRRCGSAPRHDLEGRGIGERQHVGFLGRGKAPRWPSRQSQYPPQKRPRGPRANGKVLEGGRECRQTTDAQSGCHAALRSGVRNRCSAGSCRPFLSGGFRLVYIADTIAEKCFRRVKAYQAPKNMREQAGMTSDYRSDSETISLQARSSAGNSIVTASQTTERSTLP